MVCSYQAIQRVSAASPYFWYCCHGNVIVFEPLSNAYNRFWLYCLLQLSFAQYTAARHNSNQSYITVWDPNRFDKIVLVSDEYAQRWHWCKQIREYLRWTSAVSVGQQRTICLHSANCFTLQRHAMAQNPTVNRCISRSVVWDFQTIGNSSESWGWD